MTQGLFSAESYNHNKNITVSIAQLRQQTNTGLEKAYQKLNMKGETARQFNSCSEDGLLGGFILNLLCTAAIMQAIGVAFPDMNLDLVQNQTLCAAFDGVTMVADENARKHRFRRVEGYPEGRRQDKIETVNHQFNLVAANENGNFTYDYNTEMEVALLSELLDMLDDLARQNVTSVNISKTDSVYKTLKNVDGKMKKDHVMEVFAVPLRKTA
jgi:hypothetical protein